MFRLESPLSARFVGLHDSHISDRYRYTYRESLFGVSCLPVILLARSLFLFVRSRWITSFAYCSVYHDQANNELAGPSQDRQYQQSAQPFVVACICTTLLLVYIIVAACRLATLVNFSFFRTTTLFCNDFPPFAYLKCLQDGTHNCVGICLLPSVARKWQVAIIITIMIQRRNKQTHSLKRSPLHCGNVCCCCYCHHCHRDVVNRCHRQNYSIALHVFAFVLLSLLRRLLLAVVDVIAVCERFGLEIPSFLRAGGTATRPKRLCNVHAYVAKARTKKGLNGVRGTRTRTLEGNADTSAEDVCRMGKYQ